MSIIRVGSNAKFAAGWEQAFKGKKNAKAAAAKPAKSGAKKSSKKKSAKKGKK